LWNYTLQPANYLAAYEVQWRQRSTSSKRTSIASRPGEINKLVLLAAQGNGPAERIKAPLLVIVAKDDANDEELRLPHIRAWFDKAPEPKKLIVLDASAHAQFLFQTNQADRVMKEVLRFLSATKSPN
jgi:alpha-beta hydrolase superfamily lysophospholipase